MRNSRTLPVVATSMLMAVRFCCNCNCFLKTFLHYFTYPISCLVIPMWTKIVVNGLAAPPVPLFIMTTVNCLFIWILFHTSELEPYETKYIVLVHYCGTLITSEIVYIELIHIYLDAYNTDHSCSYVSTTKLGCGSTVAYTCFPKFLNSMHTGEYWLFQIRRKCTNLIFPAINFSRIIPGGITSFQWLCCLYSNFSGKSIKSQRFYNFRVLLAWIRRCWTEGCNVLFFKENTFLGCLWQHS